MDAILARSRYRTELPVQKQTARGIASALARLLPAILERLILRQREMPSEFFPLSAALSRDSG